MFSLQDKIYKTHGATWHLRTVTSLYVPLPLPIYNKLDRFPLQPSSWLAPGVAVRVRERYYCGGRDESNPYVALRVNILPPCVRTRRGMCVCGAILFILDSGLDYTFRNIFAHQPRKNFFSSLNVNIYRDRLCSGPAVFLDENQPREQSLTYFSFPIKELHRKCCGQEQADDHGKGRASRESQKAQVQERNSSRHGFAGTNNMCKFMCASG